MLPLLLFTLMFLMEMSVMLSFSPLAVEQLSDSPELPGFCGSSDSLFFRHLNLRLTTLTRMITTTTRMTMKLMTPEQGRDGNRRKRWNNKDESGVPWHR